MAVLNRHTHGTPKGAVAIVRPGPWGNPFVLGRDGNRAEVIRKFRSRLWARIREGGVAIEDLAALHGRDLVCVCAPRPCHGDVLARAAAWAHREIQARKVPHV